MRVSVVIPCLNEEESIGACLDSLIDGGYPIGQLEILVVDGGSTDATRAIVEERMGRCASVRLLNNPRRTQQCALNIGIRAAAGDYIIRMDGHARFAPGYIAQCVSLLQSSGADNVGGRLVTEPRRNTAMGRAIAAAMSDRFGVGNSDFRIADAAGEPRWVGTVPYSCYRRDVFDRVGLFNEALDRSEDAEFHYRMRQHGCRTLFSPMLVSYYAARSDYRSFARHAIDNGRWAVLPVLRTGRMIVSARHLLPMFAVVTLLALGLAAAFSRAAAFTLAALAVAYALAALLASATLAVRRRDPALFVLLPAVFATLHLGYGVGSLLALFSHAAAPRSNSGAPAG